MSDASDSSHHQIGPVDVTRWRTRGGRRLAATHLTLAKRIGSHGAMIATLVIGGGVAAIATFGASRIYDGVTSRDGIQSLDGPALALGKKLRSPMTDAAAAGIAYGFGPVGMPILALAAGGAIARRQREFAPLTLVVAAGLGSLLMTVSGKGVIHRNRPHHRDAIAPFETSPSFPSGHTLNATTVVGTVAYLVALRQRRNAPQVAVIGAAAGTAITVGLSRVLLGAHWFTDVAVGWTTGAGWLALVITSHRLYLTTRHGGRTPLI